HVLGGRTVRNVPAGRSGDRATDCFPNTGGAGHEMATATTRPGGIAIVAAWNSAVKNIVRQNKRLRVAKPAAGNITPARAGRGTIAHAAMNVPAIVALPETQTGSSSHGIDPRSETIATFAHLPLHRTPRATCERD